MTKFITLLAIACSPFTVHAQLAERAIAIPITNYIVDSNDSIKIVQVQMPDGWALKQKQLGVLRPLYRGVKDTTRIGYGRCQLIKGDYYYFGMRCTKGKMPEGGDLIYTMVKIDTVKSDGTIPLLAAHAIVMQDVYGKDLYDRWKVLGKWDLIDDVVMLQTMADDIQFTGKEMKRQSPGDNKTVTTGAYKGKLIFDEMITASPQAVQQFLDYVTARPQMYAGNSWKISETFATWMDQGAPMVK